MERVDSWIDAGSFLDRLWPLLTDMEAAVCTLLMYGWSPTEINEHFEWSTNTVYPHISRVREKAQDLLAQVKRQRRLPLLPDTRSAA